MQTIKKINGINGGNPCRCFWEIPEKRFNIEEAGCAILSPHLISKEQKFCRNLCCKGYDASHILRRTLPPQSYYEYDNKVYSCSRNKELGYTSREVFYQAGE